MGKKAFSTFIDWLEGKAGSIRALEDKAQAALHTEQNQTRYKEIMLTKASVLASLADDAAPLVALLPENDRGTVSDGLSRFAQSASVAKRIGSVFYMSALLYPEDFQAGAKNDLEVFIDTVRMMDSE